MESAGRLPDPGAVEQDEPGRRRNRCPVDKNLPADALAAIRPADADPRDKVFAGVNGQTIGRRFTAAALATGVDGLTAHSARIGHASELTVRGASATEVMRSGGWKTSRMIAHYAFGASAERGVVAKYL